MRICAPPCFCYVFAMADQRALLALHRIEEALARIEASPSLQAPATGIDQEEHDRLRSAHEQLRQRVGAAIGQIDHLLQDRPH